MNQALIKCPCCNAVLKITITCDTPPPPDAQPLNVAPSEVDRALDDALGTPVEKQVHHQPQDPAKKSDRKYLDSLWKMVNFTKMSQEEEIYTDYEITRIRKQLLECPCSAGCSACNGVREKLTKLETARTQSQCEHTYRSIVELPAGKSSVSVRCSKCGHERSLDIPQPQTSAAPQVCATKDPLDGPGIIPEAAPKQGDDTVCGNCGGLGAVWDARTPTRIPCLVCNGQGILWKKLDRNSGCTQNAGGLHSWIPCVKEDGTYLARCTLCKQEVNVTKSKLA